VHATQISVRTEGSLSGGAGTRDQVASQGATAAVQVRGGEGLNSEGTEGEWAK